MLLHRVTEGTIVQWVTGVGTDSQTDGNEVQQKNRRNATNDDHVFVLRCLIVTA